MELSAQHSPNNNYLNRPRISSPLNKDDLPLNLDRSATINYSPKNSGAIRRSSKAGVRRSATISQVFDMSPFDNLSSSPMATAVFAGGEKSLATKAFLNRHLKKKSSISSLSLMRSPSITTEYKSKDCTGIKFEESFRDLHSCLEAEYHFNKTKPLVKSGRYLLKKGPLKLKTDYGEDKVYVFLFSDSLVYGKMLGEEPNGLIEQKMLCFMNLKLDSNLVENTCFTLKYNDEVLIFSTETPEDCDRWAAVVQSGITFHCTLSQRKAKEVSISTMHSRKNSISSVNSHLDERRSRRSSFYNSLKDLVGSFI